MNKNILIIEDDTEINNLIKETLEKEDYSCTQAFSGTKGLLRIKDKSYNLIILDLMLPGIMGEEFIKKFRRDNNAPILVISAKSSLDSKIESLELGADDYLVKPFDIKELSMRVEVLLRRFQIDIDYDVSYQELILDKELYDLKIGDILLNLTKQEYKIMELLMKHPKKVFTKQEIYQYAWDEYYIGEEKTINVHISNIRKKLRAHTDKDFIETVWGIGFKLQEQHIRTS